jgi:uncharacterized protein (TIGR00297 family)
VAVNLVLAFLALRAGSVRPSGFWGGLLVGIPIYLCLGWPGFLVLSGMFVAGTLLTRMGYRRKEELGTAEGAKGARGMSHALANGGVAAAAALLAWGLGEPLFAVAMTGALATSSMDTAGSEVGPLYGKKTISLKSFRAVPAGTEGAVSLEGTLAGLLVAGLLAFLAAGVGLIRLPEAGAVVLGAVAGNLYEGILGSRQILHHTWLNATNTLVGAGVALLVAGLA